MVQISQLILGETGCVSYIIYCKKEAVIVDSFQGFEMIVEKELKKLHNPQIKYVIDTHTHADRRLASPIFRTSPSFVPIVFPLYFVLLLFTIPGVPYFSEK